MDKTETSIPHYAIPVVPQAETPEPGCSIRLSERDAAEVLATAENPPAPNEASFALREGSSANMDETVVEILSTS